MVKALGRPELAADERFTTNAGRVTNKGVLIPTLQAEVGRHTIAEVRALMDAAGVPNAPVQRLDQVLHDEQVAALGIIQQGPEGALPTLGLPIRFDGERPAYERAVPKLGADGSVLDVKK
jgi:crotonobetainyl-CoA:carnitine CoA-transferase CaiB-like acyl-CoA transferase